MDKKVAIIQEFSIIATILLHNLTEIWPKF